MKKNLFFMMDVGARPGLIGLLLLAAVLTGRAQSCDSTSCHCNEDDMNPSGIMVGHSHPKGVWMLSYRYMNMRMRDNMSGTERRSDDVILQNYIMSPATMNMDMHMLMAMYGISDRLSVMAMFNYSVLSMKMNMLPGTMHMQMNGMTMSDMSITSMTSQTSGLADTKLYAMYTVWTNEKHRLVASLGLNVPTGNIQMKGDAMSMQPGQRLPYMMQLGTGTWDILPGITYQFRQQNLSWGTQVTASLRPGYNTIGYAFGNDVTATTWIAYQFLPWLSASLRVEGSEAGAIRGRDATLYEVMEPDAKPGNYGGQKASCYAGMNVYWKKLANSRFSIEYGQPFYQNLNGIQLASRNLLYVGWGLSF